MLLPSAVEFNEDAHDNLPADGAYGEDDDKASGKRTFVNHKRSRMTFRM